MIIYGSISRDECEPSEDGFRRIEPRLDAIRFEIEKSVKRAGDFGPFRLTAVNRAYRETA